MCGAGAALVGFFFLMQPRPQRARAWAPVSYQLGASNRSVLFITGFTGLYPADAVVSARPSHKGPRARALAYTTRQCEAATGFGSKAAAAGWEVVYLPGPDSESYSRAAESALKLPVGQVKAPQAELHMVDSESQLNGASHRSLPGARWEPASETFPTPVLLASTTQPPGPWSAPANWKLDSSGTRRDSASTQSAAPVMPVEAIVKQVCFTHNHQHQPELGV